MGRKQHPEDLRGYGEEKKGCLHYILKILGWFCVLVFAVTFFNSISGNRDVTQSDTPARVEQADDSATPRPTATPKLTNTPKPTATPEPDTLQGWAESFAERVFFPIDSGISTLISVTCEQVDGETAPMVTVNVEFPDGAKNDSRVSAFLSRATKMNRYMSEAAKEGKIEYGSLLVIGWTTYVDKYGNESDGHAVDIRVKLSEAEKVNWENFSSDTLPQIAVSFGINPIIRDGLSLEYYTEIRK